MERRIRLHISGRVQGVGFRPFVYNLAKKYKLKGYVLNDSFGVVVEAQGATDNINRFVAHLKRNVPPASYIKSIRRKKVALASCSDFIIKDSESSYDRFVFILPDLSICDNCLRELFDKRDRRFLYPFINCTNCGPRYSIIKNIPYDRRQTTMRYFKMCKKCLTEYNSPSNRRFHAQPNACFKCGPHIELWAKPLKRYLEHSNFQATKETLKTVAFLIREGKVVAIKGVGGYHIACNAESISTVKELRLRKQRPTKPFAVMVDNIETIEKICFISTKEKEALLSAPRPIVLLRIRKKMPWVDVVAPYQKFLGVMLAYAPLHYLIFYFLREYIKEPILVMTSANAKDYPLVKSEGELHQIKKFVDAFLVHNRKIYMRSDDSVVRVWRKHIYFIRKARGYAPDFFMFPTQYAILGCGAELKHTFSLTKNNYIITSPHLGDLKNLQVYNFFLETLKHFKNIFSFNPNVVAYDYHPHYLSTQYAKNVKGAETIAVQHHHAHLASCMLENNLKEPVLGVIFDGVGFGLDEAVWGGEFIIGDYANFKRIGTFDYFGLVGKDKAIEEPWRVATYILYKIFGKKIFTLNIKFVKEISHRQLDIIVRLIEGGHFVYTSSVGRLFDALSSLLRLNDKISYEAEAAVRLEMAALESKRGFKQAYRFNIRNQKGIYVVEWKDLFLHIIDDIKRGVSSSVIAYRFHYTLGKIVERLCVGARKEYNINKVVLSGGVFQNWLLSRLVWAMLRNRGFLVFTHSRFSPNDSCISVGQVAVARAKLKKVKEEGKCALLTP